jgi:hypothetical protein
MEGEAIELLLAGDVLDGLIGEAAGDKSLIRGLLGGGEGAVGSGEEGGAVEVGGVEEKDEGVTLGVVAKVG